MFLSGWAVTRQKRRRSKKEPFARLTHSGFFVRFYCSALPLSYSLGRQMTNHMNLMEPDT
jgi:hypothetical protein